MAIDPLRSSETTGPLAFSSGLSFPVIGIGASAGGIPAMLRFLEGLPRSPGMAFVVVLHLSPSHESSAAEILQRATAMPVRRVDGRTELEADHVYVIPPAQGLRMVGGHLVLTPVSREGGRPVVIDLFFRTLARAHRERAVAIVLSGSGADGAVGLGEVKEMGGVVMAQAPSDAEFPGMPASAIATGQVDIVLPVAAMGARLAEVWQNAQHIQLPSADVAGLRPLAPTSPEGAEAALRSVMAILRERTGHDFTHYKRATVLRRIERRLQINGLPHLAAYEAYLETHPTETAPLLADMLIGVTYFFRDREAFEALERSVVPTFFTPALAGEPLRLWVPGCATGQEAYSLLMMVTDAMATTRHARDVQVFATDIDEAAIATAREGRYPDSIVADLPPDCVRRHLSHDDKGYRVHKGLRERVLFAEHNILRDPPFSQLDLVSCRNLLIYLDRDVQKDILQMFHFALRPGGHLFLGSSETADAAGRLFSPVDKKARLYRANAAVRPVRSLPRFPLGESSHRTPPALRPDERPAGASPASASLHQQLLADLAPPSVLVKSDGEVLHISGAEAYLRVAPGVPSPQLQALIDPELRPAVRMVVFQAAQQAEPAVATVTRRSPDGRRVPVNVSARGVSHPDWPAPLVLVLFEEGPAADTGLAPPEGVSLTQQLEAELHRKDELLERVIRQHEAAAEDLRASNEELQAINEELRSASEELETSKEELQSTNEELITVNHELKTKVEETSEINDDLQNLIASTEIATVFVDRDMRIKRFTPAAATVFSIIPDDVGRSLLDITHRLDYAELAADATEAFSALRVTEREVGSHDGRMFLARMLPYRTGEDRIDGAVLTFVDITSRRTAERKVLLHQERMQLIADSMPDFAILTMDDAGLVTSWSAGAERLFGHAEDDMVGQPVDVIFTPEDRAAGVPQRELAQARETGRSSDERWHLRKDGTRVFVSGITGRMRLGGLSGFAKIARDSTAREREETSRSVALNSAVNEAENARETSHLKDEFLAVMSHELKHPLNLIQVNAQLLLALPEVRDHPAVAKIGRTIMKTVKSQARIIDDLLDVSRTRAGKLVIDMTSLYLDEALQACLAWARRHAQDKGVGFQVTLPDGPLLVKADPVRIEQVALNLLSNAIKFTRPGGEVRVRLADDDGDALLEVADTGRGIAPAFLPHVFELFRQAEPATSRDHGGMGIGLALVRDLVGLHGGRVEATSPGPGRGATFRVRLPLHERTDFGALDEAPDGKGLDGLRVLYVDDTEDTAETFAMLLRLEGADVMTAPSGRRALELVDEHRFDLILSDIGMPEMDGYALVAELRARPATAGVVAIALTGYGRPQDVQRALHAGFDAHLDKPVELHKLKTLATRLRAMRPTDTSPP